MGDRGDGVVLLTGFAPFGGDAVNPSWLAVRRLAGERPDQVRAVELPTVFGSSVRVLATAIERNEPRLVVCVGQAGGRPAVTPERIAINVDDARIADNEGHRPVDVPVVPDGPAAYFSGLPVKACVAALRRAGIPAALSQTAGTFVCNHVFYGLMHELATRWPGVRGGFVHVPYAPEQVPLGAEPSLPVDVVTRALGIIVDTCLATVEDQRIPDGALH
jgi:pyroglutamyl-peptidase